MDWAHYIYVRMVCWTDLKKTDQVSFYVYDANNITPEYPQWSSHCISLPALIWGVHSTLVLWSMSYDTWTVIFHPKTLQITSVNIPRDVIFSSAWGRSGVEHFPHVVRFMRTRYSEQGEVEITFLTRFTVDHRSLLSEGESSLHRLSICLIFWKRRFSLWCHLPQNYTPVCIFCLVKARDSAGLDRRWHCLDTSKVTAAWPLFIAYFCSYSPKWKRGPCGVSGACPVSERTWGCGQAAMGLPEAAPLL